EWERAIDIALAQALTNLESVAAPAGEMQVVLGPGWPGVLLHEAIGHGLEGDFNRKGTSAFSGRIGERVAAPGVTVVDDGAMEQRRGSLTIDDEGTPTRRTCLIEDGILKGYLQDRLNARLMGMEPTGNGRRESFAHAPMPRMTNTFMLGGKDDPAELVSRVSDGIYAKSFGGGQGDITSGKLVFSCTEAYRIRGGKIAEPIKGATLIGDGPTLLTPEALVDKLVQQRRGGYCYEQNGLFSHVLETIGFDFTPLAARVLWMQSDDALTPRTHKLLLVNLHEGLVLADVGFGGAVCTGVLDLVPEVAQSTPHERFRLVEVNGQWRQQIEIGGEWRSTYQ